MEEIKIQKIETSANGSLNGWMMPIYKKDETSFEGYDLNFIYASSVAPYSQKGPHFHMKRECRLVPISGKVKLVIKNKDIYEEYTLDSDNPNMVIIKCGCPFCVYNETDSEAILLNLANHIWKPDDTDNNKYTDWNYK